MKILFFSFIMILCFSVQTFSQKCSCGECPFTIHVAIGPADCSGHNPDYSGQLANWYDHGTQNLVASVYTDANGYACWCNLSLVGNYYDIVVGCGIIFYNVQYTCDVVYLCGGCPDSPRTINPRTHSNSISQNYPNPFNPTTKISYSISASNNVKIVIYDLLGREVATLVNTYQEAGEYTVDFDASNLSSGIYIYKMESGDFKDIKRMLVVK